MPKPIAASLCPGAQPSTLSSPPPMYTAASLRDALLARSVVTPMAMSTSKPLLALERRLYRAAIAIIPATAAPLRSLESAAAAVASDERLFAAFAGGDAGAFEVLMRRHLDWMVQWASRHLAEADAEDAAQEAFLALVRKAASLTLTSELRGLLFGLLRIAVLRAQRSRHRHRAASLDDELAVAQLPGEQPTPAMAVLAQRSIDEASEALLRVCTLREQEVVLFDLEGAADRVIAAALEVTEGNVRVLRHRAIHKLREALTAPTAAAAATPSEPSRRKGH